MTERIVLVLFKLFMAAIKGTFDVLSLRARSMISLPLNLDGCFSCLMFSRFKKIALENG